MTTEQAIEKAHALCRHHLPAPVLGSKSWNDTWRCKSCAEIAAELLEAYAAGLNDILFSPPSHLSGKWTKRDRIRAEAAKLRGE